LRVQPDGQLQQPDGQKHQAWKKSDGAGPWTAQVLAASQQQQEEQPEAALALVLQVDAPAAWRSLGSAREKLLAALPAEQSQALR
jgi:hypothetical protein